MVVSVEETEALENENTNKGPQSGKTKACSTPGNPVAQAGGSSAFSGHFSTFFGGRASFAPPAATPSTGLSQSLPACLMPEPFRRSADFENYIGQNNTTHLCLDGIAHIHTITGLITLRSEWKAMHFLSFQHFPKITITTLSFWLILSTKFIPQRRNFKTSNESRQATTWTRHCKISLPHLHVSPSRLSRSPTMTPTNSQN